jgi:branched-chain amino acid transport system substrate-binding protein
MSKKAWLAIIIVIIVFGIVVGTWMIRTHGSKTIPIGAILPMTGSGAQYGEEARRGIEIALAEVNSSGGIKGVPMQLQLEDSATDAKTATFAFEKLTSSNLVQVIITEVSGVVLAMAPKANVKKVLLFNVGAQNPKIRESGPYVFSNIDDANIESKFLAEFAFNRLKAKNAAVLYADVAYGQGARDVFSATFRRLGGNIVAETAFREDGLDFRAQIFQVKNAAPEVTYLPGHTKDMAKILKQAYEMGFRPQWLSYTAFEGPDIINIAGVAANGVIYTSMSLDFENTSAAGKHFIGEFRRKFSTEPGIYAATGYDATRITANAISQVGNDASRLREFFLSMEGFEGASGITKFLPDGAVEKPLVLKVVRDGKFVIYH